MTLQMSDSADTERFIKVLTAMRAMKDLDHTKANAEIEKLYMRDEIPDVTKHTCVLIRKWVPRELAVADKEQLPRAFELINDIYHALYGSNQGTLDGIFSTDVRRPMIDVYGRGSELHKMAKTMARVSYAEKGKIIENARRQVAIKNLERIEFSSAQILGLIRECNSSHDVYTRAIGLLLASGARPIELFSRSAFSTYVPANPEDLGNCPHWIQQSCLAKKRELEVEAIKPLILLTTDQFLTSLEYVRRELGSSHESLVTASGQLKSTVITRANRAMKELFQGPTSISLYSCRGLYGTLSYHSCGRFGTFLGKNPSLGIWLNKVLGHKENDLNTANSYSNFDLVDAHKVCDDPVEYKEKLRATYLTRLKRIYERNPRVTQTQLETQVQAAVPKIPRAITREFFRQMKLAVD